MSQAERSSKAAVLENEQDIKVGYVVLVNNALVVNNGYNSFRSGQVRVSQAERSSKAAVLENEQDIKVGYVALVNSALVFNNGYISFRSGQVRSGQSVAGRTLVQGRSAGKLTGHKCWLRVLG